MANDFYTPGALTNLTVANATDVNAQFNAVAAGFDKLPAEDLLKKGLVTYTPDVTGTGNNIALAMPSTITEYSTGMPIQFKAIAANTGPVTVNVDGIGAKAIKKSDGSDLGAGDIPINSLVTMRYQGTYFQFDGVSRSDIAYIDGKVTEAAASASAAASSAASVNASATAAAAQVGLAADQVGLAADQVALATTQADRAETEADRAQALATTFDTADIQRRIDATSENIFWREL